MALSRKDFIVKYNVSNEDFTKANISYDTLIDIQEDYVSKFPKFDDAGANLVRILLKFDGVHSVKYRIKDPEHLIEKIIRKRCKNPKIDINITNYYDKIQDLIGIRILHLFKSDWLAIHKQLVNTFKRAEKPEANIRKGDLDTLFKENGCKIKVHPAGYRSVHYLIITEPTIQPYISEVQVRTIFEEAWSEIDHKVRYPYFTENNTVNQFLQIFNRLAGSADEMGEFVTILKTELLLNQQSLDERQQEIEILKGQINRSSLDEKTKADISGSLDNINISGWERVKLPSKGMSEILNSNSYQTINGLTDFINKVNVPNNSIINSLSGISKLLDNNLLLKNIPKPLNATNELARSAIINPQVTPLRAKGITKKLSKKSLDKPKEDE